MQYPQHPPEAERAPQASVRHYIAIARPDHWTKHVFILPGIVLADTLRPAAELSWLSITLGFMSAAAISSANYVINEWLDRQFDAYHPTKSLRTSVNTALSPRLVLLEYAALVATGLLVAHSVSWLFLATSICFVVSGLTYNIEPVRTKDKQYLDVLSEAINNPIRLVLGWSMVDPGTLPPSSVLLAYWMGGAFLMGTKRLSEYREIAATPGRDLLAKYRRSFAHYTEEKLLVSSFTYALLSAFFIAVFFIKYRTEYILALPAFAWLFATYFAVSLEADSVAQRPEKLFRQTNLVSVVGITLALLVVLTFIDIPFMENLSVPFFLTVHTP
jgi:4-hydroxybenzoate polyprenyltransferase